VVTSPLHGGQRWFLLAGKSELDQSESQKHGSGMDRLGRNGRQGPSVDHGDVILAIAEYPPARSEKTSFLEWIKDMGKVFAVDPVAATGQRRGQGDLPLRRVDYHGAYISSDID
jgi:hypothetical protein